MHLKQMETLYWIERLGSFTAAAERLDATQSTISARIRELEAFLGVELFDRSHRTPRLTPKGKEMAAYVRRFIALAGEMRDRAAPEAGVTGRVRLGVGEAVGRIWLPAFIKELHKRHPGIMLEFDITLSAELIPRLRKGDFDVIFSLWMSSESAYVAHSLGTIEYHWIASPKLGLPKRKLKPKDLDGLPILTTSRNALHHIKILEWLDRHDVRPSRIDSCNSLSILALMAAEEVGITALPRRAFSHMIADKRIVPLDVEEEAAITMEYNAVHAADDVQSAVAVVRDLALEISDFDKPPAPSRRRPGR